MYSSDMYRLENETFGGCVLRLAMAIPMGCVATYGDIARAAGGGPQSARSITGILSRAYKNGNTDIPFHRIVYSNGRVWIGNQADSMRMQLYAQEGIKINEQGRIVDFDQVRYEF